MSASLARRRGLVGADAEDFLAHVRGRFVESDYVTFSQFRNESSLGTFLTVVIGRWLKDYLVARDGRWRPSTAALRAGPVAVLLERYVTKLGYTADEAIARVLSGGDQPYSERELRLLLHSLPRRDVLRPRQVSEEAVSEFRAGPGADAHVVQEEHERERTHASQVLSRALRTLPEEDRLLVSMRFLDGQSIADIARTLGVEQKPLYRRSEKALASLRRELETAGLDHRGVRDLLTEEES